MKRGIVGILGFLGLWVLLTALLAYPVVLGVKEMAPGVFPFSRIFGRVQMGVALALIPFLLRFWAEDPRRWTGRVEGMGRFWRMGRWGAFGIGLIVLVALGQTFLGARSWAGWPGAGVWIGAAATGILVAVLEEFFFRGVLGLAWWRAMRYRYPFGLIIFGALIFSVAHYLRPVAGPEEGWGAGWMAWGRLELWAGSPNGWKLAVLFLMGMILGRMVWDKGSLTGAVGLHAGLVAGLRWAEQAWPTVPQSVSGWWGPSLDAGPLPFCLLLVVTLILWGRPIRAHLD